jgi:hypothetical protein
MKQNKKIELLSKSLIKKSILKYSNLNLFERREKEYKSDNNIKKKAPKLFKSNRYIFKNIDETKENNISLFYNTMSSFHHSERSSSILPLLDYFENYKKKTRKKRKKNYLYDLKKSNNKTYQYSFNRINKTSENFFLTDRNATRTRNDQPKNNLSILQNKDIDSKKNNSNADILLLIKTSRNEDNNNDKVKKSGFLTDRKNNLKYFSYIKYKQNKNSLEKLFGKHDKHEAKYIIDTKLSKYKHHNQPKLKDFIKKTQEFKIQSYAAKVKEERAMRLEEEYYNQIQFYHDTMNSLESAKKLLDIQFTNKIADYTRFLISKREREIVKSSKLIQIIISHKKDIEHIKSKITKIEIEKSNIIKWIYFMIQIKEKKLVLPQYYKTIIERDRTKRTSKRQGTRKDRTKNRKYTNRRPSISKAELMFLTNKDNKENKENKDSKENKESREIRDIEVEFKEDINKDNKDKENRREEIEKIMNYKNNLIFQTVDEFQDRLSGLENENIILLNYNNKLNAFVLNLKRELSTLLKNKEKDDSGQNNISSKEKELANIKNMIKAKKKIISDFKKRQEFLENFFKKEKAKNKIQNTINLLNNNSNENKSKNKNKNSLLYRTINSLFEESKIIGNKLPFSYNILCLIEKKIYSKEKEMLFMLEYIEQTIDYLRMSIQNYMDKSEKRYEFIKNVKMDIEREHKVDKARIQMLLELQKRQMLKEKVEKRSNKIYFLPTKKIDLNQLKFTKKGRIINNSLNKEPSIKDFLYNEKDIYEN